MTVINTATGETAVTGYSYDLNNRLIKETTGKAVYTYEYDNNGNQLSKTTAQTYTVQFDSGGGSAVEQQVVMLGETATKPANPVKAGHIFVGWCDTPELIAAYDFNQPVSSRFTLYARWMVVTQNCYVVINVNNGSMPSVRTVAYGQKLQLGTPVRNGYIFDGWYTDLELTILYDFDQPVYSNMSLTAKWIVTSDAYHSVTFNTGAPSPYTTQKVKHGEKSTKPTNPTKAGYHFGG